MSLSGGVLTFRYLICDLGICWWTFQIQNVKLHTIEITELNKANLKESDYGQISKLLHDDSDLLCPRILLKTTHNIF